MPVAGFPQPPEDCLPIVCTPLLAVSFIDRIEQPFEAWGLIDLEHYFEVRPEHVGIGLE